MEWMEKANQDFERRLRPELPLDYLLTETADEPLDAAAMEKMAKAQEQPNPWTGSAFDISKGERSEDAPVRYFDLAIDGRDPLHQLVARAVREELKRHASNAEPDEEEELPEVQLPEDRGADDVNSRRVESMAASIRSKMADGASKDAAVGALMKMAGSEYSRGIVSAAAELVTA
jgi:hypothetical protein